MSEVHFSHILSDLNSRPLYISHLKWWLVCWCATEHVIRCTCIYTVQVCPSVTFDLSPPPLSSSSSEIPQYRLPYDVVSFEVELMKDLGVKVQARQCILHPIAAIV